MSGNAKFRWFLLAPIFLAISVGVNSPVASFAGELEDAQDKVRLNTNDAQAHHSLGWVYVKLGQYQDAIASYKEAIRIRPDYSNTHFNLGIVYKVLGQQPNAIASYKEAIRLNPNDVEAQSNLGNIYIRLGRYQEAITLFKEAIRINPNFANAHNNLGYTYYKSGQYQNAITSYKEALRIKPDFALAQTNLTKLNQKLAQAKPFPPVSQPKPQPSEELADAQERVRLYPDNANAHRDLGISNFKFGRYPEALIAIKEAIRLEPNDSLAHTALGSFYFYKNQFPEAIVSLKEAIRLNQDMFLAHHHLGNIYYTSGREQEATIHLKEAIRLNPNDFWSHMKLGWGYKELERYQEAIAHLKEAIRIKPNDSLALRSLGLIYYDQGKVNKALSHLKEAGNSKPNDPEILSLLGNIYWELDNPRKAVEVLERALRINPIPPRLNAHINGYLSEAYEKLERYDDAIKAAKNALEIDYEAPFANFILGLSYDAKKDGLNAISHMITAAKGFQKSEKIYKEQERWSRRNDQKYRAKSKKKLREFYSKYDYRPEDFGEEGSATAPSIPRVAEAAPSKEQAPQSGTGSGFFVSKMGHVVTNAHVVKGCKKIMVGDNANKQVPAEVINTDRSNDLALLKLSSLELASAESKSLIQKLSIAVVPLASKGLLRNEDVRLGEKVLVAGFPFGDFFSNSIKVTTGVVSSTRGAGDDSGQFQLDAAVQPGNSGGPIYDSGGNIVGVVISQLDKLKVAKAIGSLPENVNFGIKASTVRQFLISSGLPSKKAEQTEEKSTEQLAEIAQNQALMVMCFQ
jgi:tetratricopeptide (TPR) repeat protein/V8-like Glu-specific endopeptidase